MLGSSDVFVNWLTDQLGVAEDPPGSNRTPIGEAFGWNGVPWCAETVSLGLEAAFGSRVLWTASVAEAIRLARSGSEGLQWRSPASVIQVGDLSCFDFGGHGDPHDFHISAVVNPGTQDAFETIGGNEDNRVMRQWRDRSAVMGFVRPPFTTIGLGDDFVTEETLAKQLDAALDRASREVGDGNGTGWLIDAAERALMRSYGDSRKGTLKIAVGDLAGSIKGKGAPGEVTIAAVLEALKK